MTATTTTISSLLKAHERLILVLVALGISFFAYGKYLSMRANADSLKFQQAEATLNAQVKINEQQAIQNAALVKDLEAKDASLVAANTSLVSKQTAQIKQVESDTLIQVAAEWQRLTSPSGGQVVATPTGATVNADAARQAVEALDTNIELKAELTNETQVVVNLQKIVDAQQIQIVGLKVQIGDATAACNAQVKSLKAGAAKSKRNAFLHGLEMGLGVGAGLVAYLLK